MQLKRIKCLSKFMATMLRMINHVRNSFDVSRMLILALKTSLAVDSQTNSKTKNWRHYSMKIRLKRKKSSQIDWEWLNNQFPLKTMWMIQKQGNWVLCELKSRNADFAACQRSVQCCKIGENLLGNAEMGGITQPAVLSRWYSFRLPFVSIDGT